MAGIVPLPRGAAGTEEIETHPLLNPVVLKRLFELIPFELEDFRSFRLVSRDWKNLSLSKWRENAWLKIIDSPWVDSYIVVDEEDLPWMTRQTYLGLIENEQLQLVEHPFRKYILRDWKIELQSINQDGEQDQICFWNRVGPLMTHLELSICNFAGVADFRTVIFEATPNLQSLKLWENDYNDKKPAKKEQRLDPKLPQHAVISAERVQNNLVELVVYHEVLKSFPITWMELIIHFPNIKKLGPLQVGLVSCASPRAVEAELLEFFQSAEILRKERGQGYLANLTDLDLTRQSYRGILISSISRLQFSLKRIDIEIDPTVDEETFRQLLQHPLEYLNVRREFDENTMPFQNFPFGLKFMALKKLKMSGPIAPNLAFLRECPNLEQFSYFLRDVYQENLTQGLIDGNITKWEKLTDLTLYRYELGTEEIRKLGELMPNVKSLEIGLDDRGFRAVCEIWKDLEHLTINFGRVGEEAFLGKDEESGKKFHHPNITDLKNLKKFKMEVKLFIFPLPDNLEDEFRLTDTMILDGLLDLPNLKEVVLYLSSQVSPHVRSQLQSKFPNCRRYYSNW